MHFKKFLLLLMLLASMSFYAVAQSSGYKNLVLEGGGIRGLAYSGALEVLDSLGILQNIERVGGTSAGAIQATLLAIGYSPVEMLKAVTSIPLKDFNDGFIPGGLSRMTKRFGFYKGEKLYTWLEQLIASKTGDSNITFMQLHLLRAQKSFKDLYITGTDLTYRVLTTFSYENYPAMRIKDALRISFSIPLYFEPVLIDDNGTVQTDRKNKKLHLMVDGGLLSNYPIHLFDSSRYMKDSITNFFRENHETLGLLLDKPEQLHYNYGTYPLPIRSLSQYISAVYQTLIDKPNPDLTSLRRTITISHLNLSGRVRRLPAATIQKLVESGRQGVRQYFEQKVAS